MHLNRKFVFLCDRQPDWCKLERFYCCCLQLCIVTWHTNLHFDSIFKPTVIKNSRYSRLRSTGSRITGSFGSDNWIIRLAGSLFQVPNHMCIFNVNVRRFSGSLSLYNWITFAPKLTEKSHNLHGTCLSHWYTCWNKIVPRLHCVFFSRNNTVF